jgi:hemin uptake protein HemP
MGQDTRHDTQRGAATTATTAQAVGESRQIALTANRLDARDLFVATREITIGHGEETYRLRLTSQNKLILTK